MLRIDKILPLASLLVVLAAGPAETAASDGGDPPSVDSLRTGSLVGEYERLYYGLFPDISGFRSASVEEMPDGEIAFVITRTGESDTTVRIPASLADSLRIELVRYESYTLDDLQHPLVSSGIMLPHNGCDPNDDALVVRLADTSAGDFRLLCILDDSLAIITPRSETADTLLLAQISNVKSIISATTLMRTGLPLHPIWIASIGLALGYGYASTMLVESNSGERQSVADGSTALSSLASLSPIYLLAIGGLFTHWDAASPTHRVLNEMSNPKLRWYTLLQHLNSNLPPPPHLRSSLTTSAAREADSLSRMEFDRSTHLRRRLSRSGNSGLSVGFNHTLHFINTGSWSYSTPIGLYAQFAQPVISFGGWSTLLRCSAGFGILHRLNDAFADLSLVTTPSYSWWMHAGMTYESIRGDFGTYQYCIRPFVEGGSFRKHLFTGLGAGFRTGRSTSLEFTARISIDPIIRGNVDAGAWPYTNVSLPVAPHHRLFLLRTIFTVELGGV